MRSASRRISSALPTKGVASVDSDWRPSHWYTGDGCGPALHLHLAQRFVAVPAARRSPRLLADDDVTARTLGLEPGRDVQGIADEVGVACPDHDLTGVHRDPQGEIDTVRFRYSGGEVDEALLQLDRGVDGAAGVVGPYLGNTPDGHEPVADVLRDACPVALGGRAEKARDTGSSPRARSPRRPAPRSWSNRPGRRTSRSRSCVTGRRPGRPAQVWPDRRAARRTPGRIARWRWLPPRRSRRPARVPRRSLRRSGRPLRSWCRRKRRRGGVRPSSVGSQR